MMHGVFYLRRGDEGPSFQATLTPQSATTLSRAVWAVKIAHSGVINWSGLAHSDALALWADYCAREQRRAA